MQVMWYKRLYVGEGMRGSERRVRRQLEKGLVKKPYYLITLASNGVDCLDIVHSFFLKQRVLRERLPMVVGVAETKQEALDIVRIIAVDCFVATGGADIRAFLKE